MTKNLFYGFVLSSFLILLHERESAIISMIEISRQEATSHKAYKKYESSLMETKKKGKKVGTKSALVLEKKSNQMK